MKRYFHGSPVPGLTVLEPKLDPRLKMNGVFVADEPYGPMMFALLPARAHAQVNYTTKEGKFIEGQVVTPAINDEGWLYTLEAEDEIIKEAESVGYYLIAPIKVVNAEKVSKDEVEKLGWQILIKK